MDYVSSGSVDESVRRITERSYRGGHSASERLVAEIYSKSMNNLLKALEFPASGIETVRVYDNSVVGGRVKQVVSLRDGQLKSVTRPVPLWITSLFKNTKYEIK